MDSNKAKFSRDMNWRQFFGTKPARHVGEGVAITCLLRSRQGKSGCWSVGQPGIKPVYTKPVQVYFHMKKNLTMQDYVFLIFQEKAAIERTLRRRLLRSRIGVLTCLCFMEQKIQQFPPMFHSRKHENACATCSCRRFPAVPRALQTFG